MPAVHVDADVRVGDGVGVGLVAHAQDVGTRLGRRPRERHESVAVGIRRHVDHEGPADRPRREERHVESERAEIDGRLATEPGVDAGHGVYSLTTRSPRRVTIS